MHICNVRSQVFFPGVWVCLRDFIFYFFIAALSASLHCGKTLGPEKSFEYGKVFGEYGWETRTFEEGKKKAPLIQGGGLRQAHTIEKVENPSSRLLMFETTDIVLDSKQYRNISRNDETPRYWLNTIFDGLRVSSTTFILSCDLVVAFTNFRRVQKSPVSSLFFQINW